MADLLQPLEHSGDLPLMDTLDAFLNSNGHVESTAVAMGLHRHTVRKRLSRIADLAQYDLVSAQVTMELWLALRALERLAPR